MGVITDHRGVRSPHQSAFSAGKSGSGIGCINRMAEKSKLKPFDPDQVLSKSELRAKVKSYMQYLLKMAERPDEIRAKANILREELGLYEDIDTGIKTKVGIIGVMVARTIIQMLKFQNYKKLVIQTIISALQEELERMEHCEMIRRIRGKK